MKYCVHLHVIYLIILEMFYALNSQFLEFSTINSKLIYENQL